MPCASCRPALPCLKTKSKLKATRSGPKLPTLRFTLNSSNFHTVTYSTPTPPASPIIRLLAGLAFVHISVAAVFVSCYFYLSICSTYFSTHFSPALSFDLDLDLDLGPFSYRPARLSLLLSPTGTICPHEPPSTPRFSSHCARTSTPATYTPPVQLWPTTTDSRSSTRVCATISC
jgi:hypothetical protein